MADASQCTMIYMALCERGTKIGITGDRERRQSELKAFYGRDARIVRVWSRPTDCRVVEWVACQLLAHFRVPGHQELFTVTRYKASRTVTAAIALVEAGDYSQFVRGKMPKSIRHLKPPQGWSKDDWRDWHSWSKSIGL